MAGKTNVIFIYADDLGQGMLSHFGQKHFKTDNIDRIFSEGTNFLNAYGCHICAPARASLICGVHDCHCGRWQFTKAGIYCDYADGKLSLEQVYELIHNTGIEERSGEMFLPMLFGKAGYITGQIGKLEWGFATTGDAIKKHGWEYHYGYYDHQMCHGYYPPFVFENGERIDITGNLHSNCASDQYNKSTYEKNGEDIENGRAVYSQDIFDNKIIEFIEKNKDRPFFLYHPSQLPHGQLSIPEIHASVAESTELNLSEKVYASMVLRLDETVGKIFDTLQKNDILENTLIIFSSDNGHSPYYTGQRLGHNFHFGADGLKIDNLNVRYTSGYGKDIFDGNNGRTGMKASNFEGGTKVPLAFYQSGKIAAKSIHRLVTNYDFMATMAEWLDVDCGTNHDGVSYISEVYNNITSRIKEHDYVVFASEQGPAIVTNTGYKLRTYITDSYKLPLFGESWKEMKDQVVFELYDLKNDYCEETDIADSNPELVKLLQSVLLKECDGNYIHGTTPPHFVFYSYDY